MTVKRSHTCSPRSPTCVAPRLRPWAGRWQSELPLFLVVHRRAGDLLPLRISSSRSDRSALAVCRQNDSTANRNFAALRVGERQGAVVHLLVRPHVRNGISRDRVFLAIEFAGPLVMCSLPLGVRAVYRNFHAVTRGFVDDLGIFRRSGTDLGLGLVQFPGADPCVFSSEAQAAGKTPT